MAFFNEYILQRNATEYKTATEKDWAYIARREYRYDVNVRAAADAYFVGHIACMVRMFMLKKFVIWPFAPVFVATYLYRAH